MMTMTNLRASLASLLNNTFLLSFLAFSLKFTTSLETNKMKLLTF